MKISILRVVALKLRRNTVLAAMITVAPLIGGCVSAMDDSTAFGFGGNAAAGTAVAAAQAEGQPTTGADAAAADASDPATAASIETAAAEGDVAPTVAASAEPADPAVAQQTVAGDAAAAAGDAAPVAPGTIASGRATIAAYAGATVSPASETTQPSADGRPAKAGSTLFASLFAQSEAKTPVRNSETGKSQRVILKPEGAPAPVEASLMSPASASTGSPMESLPGVKSRDSLFEIGQRASADYDAEILEEASGEEGTYEVASLSGMARLAPNGLMVQRPDVQTSCFEPKLVSMLRAVEQRFRTKVVVTSGYRSPSHNKRVSGARKSMHMSCKAADIQVPGANKIEVANFLRGLPGRGGVGTYCHTTAVHVDVGKQRDWNWACRRRRS